MSLLLASWNVIETQDKDFRVLICQNLGRISYTLQQWLSGGDEVSGESWQLVTAVHDRGEGGEGLIHCEWHLWGSNGIFGQHFTSGFAGANTMVTFKHWCGFSLQSHRLYFVHMKQFQSTSNCAEGHEASRILCWQCGSSQVHRSCALAQKYDIY
jgi:hypothetical protein